MSGAYGSLWTLFPGVVGGVLHMLVVRRGWLAALAVPLDGGWRWRGRRLFGDHKTWRGLLVIPAGTLAGAALQRALQSAWPALAAHDWLHAVPAYELGLVWGFGYALAELPNSFLKRRFGIAPGAAAARAPWLWALLDQADSPLCCAFLAYACGWLDAGPAAVLAVSGTGVHLAANALLFLAGLRTRPL